MEYTRIGSNQRTVTVGDVSVLISYETPVAYVRHGNGHVVKTTTKFSPTTSKHINAWVRTLCADVVVEADQAHIVSILDACGEQ